MNFLEIAEKRYSCRSYDSTRMVEPEKIESILNAVRLSPSACNGQPYFITVCTGEKAKQVAKATIDAGLNAFAVDAPVLMVISEMPYTKMAALGVKLKNNDYRSMDIGIAAAYLTAQATELGLGTCILGWLDSKKIQKICSLEYPVRLVVTVGYAKEEKMRTKKRKDIEQLVKMI